MDDPAQTTAPPPSPHLLIAAALSDPGHDILLADNADTLVYIDPPSFKSTGHLQPESPSCIPHRVNSQNLLRTESLDLTRPFEARKLAPTIKRRGLAGVLPSGIRYVVDLTPPSEGDEAVTFTTELSCPLGIRTWARSKERWGLPEHCVGGTDENEEGGSQSALPAEYSGSRHRRGIVDILKVLHYINPCLDTPCKMWTYFALAKVLGIATHSEINVHILTWVYDPDNTKFIELHPEVAYRIACGIQCERMCQDAFSILVGEEALLRLADAGKEPRLQWPSRTIHGRPREPLEDGDRQRVEYASHSLLDRVIDRFLELAGADMLWFSQITAYHSIQAHTHTCYDCEHAANLVNTLKQYIRGHIFTVLAVNAGTAVTGKLSKKVVADDSYPTQDFVDACNSMSLPERIMTYSFWKGLVVIDDVSHRLFNPGPELGIRTLADVGSPLASFLAQGSAEIGNVDLSDLLLRANQYNRHVDPMSPRFGFRTIAMECIIEARTNTGVLGPLTWQHLASIFNPQDFIDQARSYIAVVAEQMIQAIRPDASFSITDTLTCLVDSEIQFLPLWAGGNEDGTGGVYTDQGMAELDTCGFSMFQPAVPTGHTVPSSISFPGADTSMYESTVQGASHRATASHLTDVMSVASEAFSAFSEDLSEQVDNIVPCVDQDAGTLSTSSGKQPEQADEDEFCVNMDSSADDELEDYFDTDSDDDDGGTAMVDSSGAIDALEDVAAGLERIDLGDVEAVSD
ncbi:hypothetical protein BO70DRAFT_377073 [Aspergillus heteromorphus CBS 117.55]|uniref:Uncharacterized protein n=1 Tax=Aspergillus heteromorphus CBS 117.55 TaxID=1448321 RepID=A0A317WUP8_9EURO|nr:uncharacterized protein BO70DRAFT_377073 [Aspergillus heteromorphus CBS 117.55]PWY89805.1 hypothetical protein BO70DRAFT_377073 [Aspergillus heteromorphus CBS 117.55]